MILLATSSGVRLDTCRREWTSVCRSVTVAVRLLDPLWTGLLNHANDQSHDVLHMSNLTMSKLHNLQASNKCCETTCPFIWSKPKTCRVLIHSHLCTKTLLLLLLDSSLILDLPSRRIRHLLAYPCSIEAPGRRRFQHLVASCLEQVAVVQHFLIKTRKLVGNVLYHHSVPHDACMLISN